MARASSLPFSTGRPSSSAFIRTFDWPDMFKTVRHLLHRVDVHPAFVGKGRRSDVGSPDVVSAVGEIVDEAGHVGQFADVRDHGSIHFQLEIGNDGSEVAVPNALSVTVDGSLLLS